MKKLSILIVLGTLLLTASLCTKIDKFEEAYFDPRLSGGAATVFNAGVGAYGDEVPGLSAYDAFIHQVGDKLFEQTFVSSPAPFFPGLGPLFNNVSCISCHHGDGKGLPFPGRTNSGMLTKLSIPGVSMHNEPLPVPGFGGQLQDKAIAGREPEGKLDIDYEEIAVLYPDGTETVIRKPIYTFRNFYMPMAENFMYSVRLGPPVFGLGLLAMIPESTILANVDAMDRDGDGIRGKANLVYNPMSGKTELGRFGLKANHATLLSQIATAYNQDMGITSYFHTQESSYGQSQHDDLGVHPEITDSMLDATVFYIQTLAVPARRNVDKEDVLKGERLFKQVNCSGCHTPSVKTGVDIRLSMMSNQRIQPFTDLLLHDMGPGLADNRPEYLATGSEWRTPPLWGLGLLKKVNGNTAFYLHDGRARSIEEAILWHGGEAEQSKNRYMQLTKTERAAMLSFLESL